MKDDSLLKAVRNGLKSELDSVTVYTDAASKAEGAVAEFFHERVEEEKLHYNWLLQYYDQLSGEKIPEENLAAEISKIKGRSPLVTQEFLRRVGESQYLVTAVASAVLLEVEAIRRYRESAQETSVPELKSFFTVLADWEERHYEDLLMIQDESEQYWFDDQRFKPF